MAPPAIQPFSLGTYLGSFRAVQLTKTGLSYAGSGLSYAGTKVKDLFIGTLDLGKGALSSLAENKGKIVVYSGIALGSAYAAPLVLPTALSSYVPAIASKVIPVACGILGTAAAYGLGRGASAINSGYESHNANTTKKRDDLIQKYVEDGLNTGEGITAVLKHGGMSDVMLARAIQRAVALDKPEKVRALLTSDVARQCMPMDACINALNYAAHMGDDQMIRLALDHSNNTITWAERNLVQPALPIALTAAQDECAALRTQFLGAMTQIIQNAHDAAAVKKLVDRVTPQALEPDAKQAAILKLSDPALIATLALQLSNDQVNPTDDQNLAVLGAVVHLSASQVDLVNLVQELLNRGVAISQDARMYAISKLGDGEFATIGQLATGLSIENRATVILNAVSHATRRSVAVIEALGHSGAIDNSWIGSPNRSVILQVASNDAAFLVEVKAALVRR